ncbi:hypothetical protein EB796_010012 [Bugula neritina]|uniref:Jumonji domain-containing protein 4 n=1 Tax=Bugula neritina TaxID=10212 RepID=A0A7J7K290_BUGNE|nr:hypothetical protein EB796_010012 [Bugula neritina]
MKTDLMMHNHSDNDINALKLNSSLNTPNNDMNTDHSIDTISAPSPIIPRIKVFGNSPSPEEIRDNYIAKNLPFILTGDACLSTNSIPWKVFDEWLVCSENGQVSQLDVEHIIRHYGEDVVPVADCSKQEYGAHPKTEMKFTEFLSRMGGGDCCLYLKDYHFVRMHEDVKLYETPAYFTSDWLNEYCVDKGKDDYRFVYLGSTGSWTPFHADVLHSFSWSANLLGRSAGFFTLQALVILANHFIEKSHSLLPISYLLMANVNKPALLGWR